MTRQQFHTIDRLRLEVAVRPTTPHNLVPNPNGALGAWGWVTPVASYMRTAPGELALEHIAAGAGTYFRTEPMPCTAGHYAAASVVLPFVGTAASLTWQIEWLDSAYAPVATAAASGTITNTGATYSRPPTLAPAGTSFFRLRFNQAAAGTARITNVRAATATTSAALASTLVNRVANPSFEVDANGWTATGSGPSSIARTTTVAHVGTASLSAQRTAPNPGTAGAYTEVQVTPGRDYTLQSRNRAQAAGGTPRLTIQWRDAAGVAIGATATAVGTVGTSTTAFDLFTLTATAPSNAVTAVLTVLQSVPGPGSLVYFDAIAFTEGTTAPAYFDGTTAASGTISHAWTGTAHASTSTRTDTTLSGLAETEWRNIIGPTHSIKIARESLNVGTLDAELLDANLDPATSSTLRPGNAVRTLALVSGVWEPTFVGEIDRLLVRYDDKRRPVRPPRVSLTATDRTRRLAGVRRPEGVAAVASLPHVLEGAGVPWNVEGSTAQLLTAPAVVSLNENATALDQIALTRDSTASHAWVNRKGVLVATSAAGASVRTLVESRYSDLQVSFASDECINAVVIEALVIVDGRSETVPYGPYEDLVSIERWGRRERRFTVHGLTAGQIATLGATILTRNANPGVSVSQVTLPMRDDADLADALRDLGEIVTVSNTARSIAPTLRVTSVQHQIQSNPQKWLVTLGFASSGSVAAPTTQPPVQSARGLEDTSWQTAAPFTANGFAHYDSTTYGPVRYRRLAGVVYVTGLVSHGPAGGSNAFDIIELPAGFRPSRIHMPGIATSQGHAACYVYPTGRVNCPGTGAFPADQWFSLAFSFPVEQ